MAAFSVFVVRIFQPVRFLRGLFFLRSRVQIQVKFLEDSGKKFLWACAIQDNQKEIFPTKDFTWLLGFLLKCLKFLMWTTQKWWHLKKLSPRIFYLTESITNICSTALILFLIVVFWFPTLKVSSLHLALALANSWFSVQPQ